MDIKRITQQLKAERLPLEARDLAPFQKQGKKAQSKAHRLRARRVIGSGLGAYVGSGGKKKNSLALIRDFVSGRTGGV